MENNSNTQQVASAEQNNEAQITMKELFYTCLREWKWFALSLFVFLALATVYLLRTPKTYTRFASIVIKEDRKGRSIATDMASAFSDMGLMASNTNVQNELLALQSRDLALSVARRLALNVNYSVDGTFHRNTIYGTDMPLKVEFPGMNDNAVVGFDIILGEKDSITLCHFTMKGEEVDGEVKGTVGMNILHTPVGRVVVHKSPYYNTAKPEGPIHVSRIEMARAQAKVLASFTAALNNKLATVIDMSYKDVSTQRAEDVLNTVISVYNENWVEDKNLIAVSTSQFINERLQVIERELGNVDNDISSYKSANQITDLMAVSNMYLEQTGQADVNILALNNQIYMAKYIRSYLSNVKNKRQLLPANSGIQNNNIENLITKYNEQMLHRNNLVSNSSEQNPIVVDLDEQLEALRGAIISSIDNEIKTLETQISSQRDFGGHAKAKISSNPTQAKYLLSVERQQKVKESLYLFLLQKREENELSQAFTAYNTRVIDVPQGSNIPTSPVNSKILLIAMVLGMCFPLGLIYLRETMNTAIRSRKDIEDKLSMPFLGEIPLLRRKGEKKWWQVWKKAGTKKFSFVVRRNSRGIVNEAFRVVSTNLEFMTPKEKEGATVFMTTSYLASSGKSFIVANLGAILTLKEKKILVIDCDLRHASLSEYFGAVEHGITDYLAGNVDNVERIIHHSEKFAGLDAIPVGTIPPNPAELLYSERFEALLTEMRKRYDYIIVDCPPIDVVTDATIVEKYVDRTLFIVRVGLFERVMIPKLERDFKSGRMKNMSLILNGTRNATGAYGYYANSNNYGYYGTGQE